MSGNQDNELLHRQKATPPDQALLDAIKVNLPQLESLLEEMECDYEDRIYRFYHQSYKVYWLQQYTQQAADLFKSIAQIVNKRLDPWFEEIVAEGTGIEFDYSHNGEWLRYTRPQVEAFLHAKYFVEMMVKYGRELDAAPRLLPSGWAAVLTLYDLR